MFNLVRVLTFAQTRPALTKNNSERQTMFNLLNLVENIGADLAIAKVNTYPVRLGRSASIQKVQLSQPFTILGLIPAPLFVSRNFMQKATLNTFLKQIRKLSPLRFQLPN